MYLQISVLFPCPSDKSGIAFMLITLALLVPFLKVLTSGPWDVLSISWWLVYHRSELGMYADAVVFVVYLSKFTVLGAFEVTFCPFPVL